MYKDKEKRKETEIIQPIKFEGVLGVRGLITARVRGRIKSSTYHKLLDIAWDALERGGVLDVGDDDLHIVVLGGRKVDIDKVFHY